MSKDAKEAIAKAPSGRPVRQTTGTRNKFEYINKEAGYEYRVAVDDNGTGDRIAELKDIGYEVCPSGVHKLGSSRVDNASSVGSTETMNAGNGATGVLMRIKKEWRDEDRKVRDERIAATEQGLKTPQFDGTYGKISINEGK